MPKLKLSEWSHIAEIATSIVVIASLAYIALEINQNTQALQHETYQSVTSSLGEGNLALAVNADLNRIVMLAQVSPDDVSAEDWSRFVNWVLPRIGTWEYLFLATEEKAASQIAWSAFDPYFSDQLCLEGYQKFWSEYQYAFAESFREYVDRQVISSCV